MKKLSKIISVAALIGVGFMHVALADFNIPLPGAGTVAAAQALPVSLDPLIYENYYDISCHVDNIRHHIAAMRFKVSGPIGTAIPLTYYLNGEELAKGFHQYILDKATDNILQIYSVQTKDKGAALYFYNLDRDYAVVVHDCIATPSVGLNKTK